MPQRMSQLRLRLYHLRNVGNDPFPGAGHPTGFRVGAPAARQNQHARIRTLQGLQIGRELPICLRMVQSIGILLEAPLQGIFVNIRPAEAIATMRRIAKVINLMFFCPDPLYDLVVIGIPPAGGDNLLNEDSDSFRIILTIIVFPAYLSSNFIRVAVY